MDHMPEASSSTAPPAVAHQATFVFDSGLSRERYSELIEHNGIVHKIVQRLMQKSGDHEQTLRLNLIITTQEAPYHNPRSLHSVIPPYCQDFRRPSAFLTSLPALVRHFTPHAALTPPKPGSIVTSVWDIEDGAGLSISASEPGLSDRFLGGLVGGLELLEHHSLPSSGSLPNALQQMTPESGLHMLSMYYTPHRSQAQEPRKQYLVVFTDKASLAAIDADTRGMSQWAREDSSAAYDDVDWDNIGERCRSKDVACSCIILGSPEGGRSTTAPLGRDGSTAEKLRNMCQASSAEGPDDVWFTLPPDSDVYLTGMPVKSTASPPPPVAAPPEIKPVLPTAPVQLQLGANGPTEAQIQYQQAQKAAMAAKMAQAAQAQGAQGSPFNALAQLISSGRLDPAVMTQLAGSIRSSDMSVRQKAMAQLSQLVIQAQSKGLGAAGANTVGNANANNPIASANGANNTAGPSGPADPSAVNPTNVGPTVNPTQNATGTSVPNITIPNMNNPSGISQQQFAAAMQARQRAMQAHTAQQQNQLGQIQAQQGNQQNLTGQATPSNQNQNPNPQQNAQVAAQTTQQLLSQQQAILIQRQKQLAQQQQQQAQQAQQLNAQGSQGKQDQAQNTGQQNSGQQIRAPIWAGTISWMLKGQERSIIPVMCAVLNQMMNPADLQLQQWPQNLEMSSMMPLSMADLQTYVKAHNAPCVLFSVAPQASPDAKAKMNYLGASLQAKGLAAFIKFGNPGCGILLVSASRGPPTPGNDQGNRLLGVVCVKQPHPAYNPATAANQNTTTAQTPQQPVTINGNVNSGAFPNVPNISPQFLQNAQLQNPLLANSVRPTPTHSRASSLSQPTQPQTRPTTLQQFANQPNMQTLQQLQMRQLAATTPQAQRPQAPLAFTEQQKQGIIKLLRDANINVTENFDPNQIPRETLAHIIGSAKEKAKQNMLKGVNQNQGQASQTQNNNPGLGLGGGLGQVNQGLNLGAGNLNTNLGQGGNMNLPAGYKFLNHMNLNNLQNLSNAGGAGGINMAQLAMGQMQNQNNANQGNTAQQSQLNAATLANLGQISGFNLQQFQAAQAAQNAQNNNGGQSALGLFGQGGLGGLNPAMLNQFQQQH